MKQIKNINIKYKLFSLRVQPGTYPVSSGPSILPDKSFRPIWKDLRASARRVPYARPPRLHMMALCPEQPN